MRQIVLFVVGVFGVTWTLGALAPLPTSLSSFLVWFLPSVWAPTVIALILARSLEGSVALRQELRARLGYTRGSARWFLVAAAVPVLVVSAAVVGARMVGDGAPFTPAAGLVPMILLQLVTGAVGEELGWRGYLLPRLGRLVGVPGAFWAMGALWSLWHLPAFFTPGMPHQSMPIMLVLPFIAFFGIFLGYLFERAGGSVLATMTAHLSLNIMTGIGGAALASPTYWATQAAAFGLLAGAITLRMRSSHRPHADEAAVLRDDIA